MKKHDFGYFFHEGLSNMFSHGFMSFAAVGITVACLLIMGTFTLVALNADANLRELESENEIVAFVDGLTAGRVPLGPGTLYTLLAKFQEEGLIRETAVEGRRRTYQITDQGRALFQQELERLRRCVEDGETQLAIRN